MESWSTERVIALAPDSGSATAGQGLATAKKWSGLGRSERAIWGLCQGTGKQPYQARVDVGEPAFKCSCPSRKFPCKHGLGLLLLFTKNQDAFAQAEEPPWVADWIDERVQRAAKKTEHARAGSEKQVDLEAQARRAAQRDARVREGVAGCRLWLEDLMRRGLAAAQSDPAAEWERAAARLVDAQATGLASFVRRIPQMMSSGPGWDVRAVDAIGRLHLLLCAAERLDQLPADVASDVRTALGWTQAREEAFGGPSVSDRWIAVGQVIEDDERFRIARTWLVGRDSGRRALILDFAAGSQPLERSVAAGSSFDGELGFYPSRQPLRAVIKSRVASFPFDRSFADTSDRTIEAGLLRFAEALGSNPWLYRWPLILVDVRPVVEGDRWFLVDAQDRGLPVRPAFTRSLQLWRLVSARGGDPLTVVAEWDGTSALPISAFANAPDAYLDLAPRWAA